MEDECSGHGRLTDQHKCVCDIGYSGRDELFTWDDCQIQDDMLSKLGLIALAVAVFYFAAAVFVFMKSRNRCGGQETVFQVLHILLAFTLLLRGGYTGDYRECEWKPLPALGFSSILSIQLTLLIQIACYYYSPPKTSFHESTSMDFERKQSIVHYSKVAVVGIFVVNFVLTGQLIALGDDDKSTAFTQFLIFNTAVFICSMVLLARAHATYAGYTRAKTKLGRKRTALRDEYIGGSVDTRQKAYCNCHWMVYVFVLVVGMGMVFGTMIIPYFNRRTYLPMKIMYILIPVWGIISSVGGQAGVDMQILQVEAAPSVQSLSEGPPCVGPATPLVSHHSHRSSPRNSSYARSSRVSEVSVASP